MEIWEIDIDWTTKREFNSKGEADKYINNTDPADIFQILYRESENKPVHVYYSGTKQQ